MNLMIARLPFLLPLLWVVAWVLPNVGCNDTSATDAARLRAQITPEKSFQDVVRLIKDGIELDGDVPNAFVFQRAGERSQISVHNEVSSTLIPPAKEGEPYRGTIMITSRSVYSLRRTSDPSEEKQEPETSESTDSGSSRDSTTDDESGVDVLDSNLVSPAPRGGKSVAGHGDTVARREDDTERSFEFVRKDNLWTQVTPTDPETELAVQRAFDRALKAQPR